MVWALSVGLAAEPCAVSRTGEELRTALDGADQAWGDDAANFAVAVDAVRRILPCVNEPVDPATAAHVHRVEGLAAFAARDLKAARLAFSAAKGVDPAWAMPETVAAEGSPLRAEWTGVAALSETIQLPAPRNGELRVDGVTTMQRPEARPALVQVVDERGRAVTSAWVPVGGRLPAYAKKPGPGWWIAAGASAAGGAALLGAAYLANDEYQRSTTEVEADAARAQVNGLAGAAAGVGAVAVGLGVFVVAGSF
ncbi:hypothetical protein LBMAG42_29800 [Deltaproteobacteria bacterium]|nr:hypothetical protein LBMAG42_29800 [Deltaproteobacteria bacterium]